MKLLGALCVITWLECCQDAQPNDSPLSAKVAKLATIVKKIISRNYIVQFILIKFEHPLNMWDVYLHKLHIPVFHILLSLYVEFIYTFIYNIGPFPDDEHRQQNEHDDDNDDAYDADCWHRGNTQLMLGLWHHIHS